MRYLRCFAFVLIGPISWAQETDVRTLLAELSRDPGNATVLYKLEGQPTNQQILEALTATFDRAPDKRRKQEVAKTLIIIGDKSDRYFEYLAGFARAAMAFDGPDPFYYDQAGHALRGMMNPELESWALARGLDPRATMAKAVYEFPEDVDILARARDERANSLFRQGLNSRLPLVVAYSAEGLALLRDTSALPMIIAACDRLKGSARTGVAWQLAKFGQNPEAEQALRRYVPNPTERERVQADAQRFWAHELQNQAQRRLTNPTK